MNLIMFVITWYMPEWLSQWEVLNRMTCSFWTTDLIPLSPIGTVFFYNAVFLIDLDNAGNKQMNLLILLLYFLYNSFWAFGKVFVAFYLKYNIQNEKIVYLLIFFNYKNQELCHWNVKSLSSWSLVWPKTVCTACKEYFL